MPDVPAADIWSRCLESIRAKVQEQSFRTWFESTSCLRADTEQVLLEVPSPFFAEWLEEHYAWLVQSTLEEVLRARPTVTYTVRGEAQSEPSSGPVSFSESPSVPAAKPAPTSTPTPSLNPRYSFNRFVVGQSNEFPFSAARTVAESPGSEAYNPLVLHGGVGLGKTHLLQAVGDLCSRNPGVGRVVYATAETFFSDYIRGIRNRDTSGFVAHYRSADVLLLDDIQFYVLTEGSQRELLHTFNALYQQNKQIVLTSDCPPSALKGFVDRLISRFQSGLVAEIHPPDLETRQSILCQKAVEMEIELCEETAGLIARSVDSNIRELEGALNRLVAYSRVVNKPVTPELARRSLLASTPNGRPKGVSLDSILQVTADYFGLPVETLTGPSRRQAIARARQVSMYLCKSLTEEPLKAIGKSFGGRDHTTVIHACRRVEDRAGEDTELQNQLGELRQRIQSSA